MDITDSILYGKTEEAVAVVTYFDPEGQRTYMVYGLKKKKTQKLRVRVNPGDVLKIKYTMVQSGGMKIIDVIRCQLPSDLNYAKKVYGTIQKVGNKNVASLLCGNIKAHISPNLVSKYRIANGDNVESLIVYDYDKKKDSWSWVSITINKK